jgi:hypothetical protein
MTTTNLPKHFVLVFGQWKNKLIHVFIWYWYPGNGKTFFLLSVARDCRFKCPRFAFKRERDYRLKLSTFLLSNETKIAI